MCASAVELKTANLSKVQDLLWDARPDWFNLGLALGINVPTLRAIRQDNNNVTNPCFTEMLSEWLKMIDPLPTWEGLISALKQRSVGQKEVSKRVKQLLGLPEESNDSDNGQ